MLISFPAKLSIVDTNARIPMYAIILFIALRVFKHFHAAALVTTIIKIRFEINLKSDAGIGQDRFIELEFHDRKIDDRGNDFAIHQYPLDGSSFACQFIFAKLLFKTIGKV